MKKIYLALVVLCVTTGLVSAQNTFPSTGNVGIGTTSPAAALDVNGAQRLNGNLTFSSDQTAYFITGPDNGGAIRIRSNAIAASDRDVQFGNIDNSSAWSSFMTVANNGNVGIGTTSPAALFSVGFNSQFEVQSNGATSLAAPAGSTQANLFTVLNSTNNGYTAISASGASSAVPTWLNGSQIVEFVPYSTGNGIISSYSGNLVFQTNGRTNRMNIDAGGNVGIGTSDTKGYLFAVNGSAIATSMTVKLNANWPDYVFKKDYQLPSLIKVKSYIDKNQHLPDMPSEQEVAKDGIDLGEMNKLLVKKVEELTLYLIEQKEKTDKQQTQIDELKSQVTKLIRR